MARTAWERLGRPLSLVGVLLLCGGVEARGQTDPAVDDVIAGIFAVGALLIRRQEPGS